MIASSSTVLSNLAYLIGAVVVAVIGGLIVWLRHRQPRSVDANMASFKRGLNALAPDGRPAADTRIHRSERAQPRPPAGLTHVRIESPGGPRRAGAGVGIPSTADQVDEPAGERSGGHTG